MKKPRKRKVSFGYNILGIKGEITEESIVDFAEDVDERIKKLSQVRDDLQAAVEAVESLQVEAGQRYDEVEKLRDMVAKLEEDKETTESLLALSKESFARVLADASSKGKLRGRVEGVVVGLTTGLVSSLAVWYLTQ